MIFLGQTIFHGWPPNPVTHWASSVVQCPSLAHLNFHPPTRLSSKTRWNTALPSGLALLPHTLLSLMAWKPRPSKSLESPTMKLRRWAYHFAMLTGRWSLCLLPHPSWPCTLCRLHALSSQVSARLTWSTIYPLLVKLIKPSNTTHRHSLIPQLWVSSDIFIFLMNTCSITRSDDNYPTQ